MAGLDLVSIVHSPSGVSVLLPTRLGDPEVSNYIKTHTIVAYTRDAAMICPDCILRQHQGIDGTRERSAEEALDVTAWWFGINRMDESSYGDEFYKVVFADQVQGHDFCDNCFEKIMDMI